MFPLKNEGKMIRVIFVILVASLISCGDDKAKKAGEPLENADSTIKLDEKSQNTDSTTNFSCANLQKAITCYNSINMESGDRSVVRTAVGGCLDRDVIFLTELRKEVKLNSDLDKSLQPVLFVVRDFYEELANKGDNASIEDMNRFAQAVVKNWNEIKNILKCE